MFNYEYPRVNGTRALDSFTQLSENRSRSRPEMSGIRNILMAAGRGRELDRCLIPGLDILAPNLLKIQGWNLFEVNARVDRPL